METSLNDEEDDYDGEAPVDMGGEAPLDGDDMMLDCSVEGNCYIVCVARNLLVLTAQN